MCSPEEINRYHCPRWNEFPDIGLYMDQVVGIIEKNLHIFCSGQDQKIITPTMINNYVKHKVIPAPVNKKYERRHVANLFVICMLKRFISLADIRDVKLRILEFFSAEDCYNLFCTEMERSLLDVYGMGGAYENDNFEKEDYRRNTNIMGKTIGIINYLPKNKTEVTEIDEAIKVIKVLTSVCANLIYANYLISGVISSGKNSEHKS